MDGSISGWLLKCSVAGSVFGGVFYRVAGRSGATEPGFSSFVRPRPPVEIGWPPLLLPALDRDLGSIPFAGATSLLNVEPGHHGAQLFDRAEAPPPIL